MDYNARMHALKTGLYSQKVTEQVYESRINILKSWNIYVWTNIRLGFWITAKITIYLYLSYWHTKFRHTRFWYISFQCIEIKVNIYVLNFELIHD